jgi:hypothetical protein
VGALPTCTTLLLPALAAGRNERICSSSSALARRRRRYLPLSRVLKTVMNIWRWRTKRESEIEKRKRKGRLNGCFCEGRAGWAGAQWTRAGFPVTNFASGLADQWTTTVAAAAVWVVKADTTLIHPRTDDFPQFECRTFKRANTWESTMRNIFTVVCVFRETSAAVLELGNALHSKHARR